MNASADSVINIAISSNNSHIIASGVVGQVLVLEINNWLLFAMNDCLHNLCKCYYNGSNSIFGVVVKHIKSSDNFPLDTNVLVHLAVYFLTLSFLTDFWCLEIILYAWITIFKINLVGALHRGSFHGIQKAPPFSGDCFWQLEKVQTPFLGLCSTVIVM